ncbi:MAG: hypothetical protein JSV80_12490 [Acidobacteriota bacterium]|nr:MAG: hypothetical protein JSV80_12490 [Acidobacteriota bacterium]
MNDAQLPQMPLIDHIAQLIERTYGFDSGLMPLGRFVVGDRGHLLVTEGRPVRQRVEHSGAGARLLLRELPRHDGWAAAIYLPNAMVTHLEQNDPRRVLGDENIDAFATLVEEVDHLLTFADRARSDGPELSLLELEWHAGVTKYLVLSHFVGRLTKRSQLTTVERLFIEHHLFHKGDYEQDDAELGARYRDATRLAVRFVRRLRPKNLPERIEQLRRFHRASHHEKLRQFS